MSKNIVEDLPARKFAPTSPVDAKGSSGKKEKGGIEQSADKKIRQAVYDIRYRARREDVDMRQAFAQYMQNSSLGQAERTEVRAKLFGKEGGGMKEQYSIGASDWAAESISSAMFKVFVENVEKELPNYLEELKGLDDKKYKVRVTDKKTGKSYVRYATREKITQLRSNPNIQSVEMTEYGEPYEGERKSGEQTAKVKAGRDYDGDGKVESGAKEYRGSVHNAIQRKKGGNPDGRDTSSVREEFLSDGTKSTEGQNITKITGKNVNNYASGAIKISPEAGPTDMKGPTTPKNVYAHTELVGELISETGYSKFLKKIHSLHEKAESEQQQKLFGLALSVKRGKTPRSEASAEVLKIVDEMSEKKIRDFAKTKHEGLPEKVEEESCGSDENEPDDRDKYAKINLVKNKLRAMGMKNPMVMVASSYDLEGDEINELNRYAKETGEDPESGRPSVRGGNPAIADTNKRIAPAQIGGSRQKPKQRGKKPPVAGEPGSGRQSPENIVSIRRGREKRARNEPIGSRFD